MLSRPKPGESEVDLLHFQSQFLAAGAAPAVQLVKKGSKKSGDATRDQSPLQDHRDVVKLNDLPDLPPALVPAPPKRARPSLGCPLPEDEDPEEKLNRHDQHITAVLTKIIERDTSSVTVNLPVPSGVAFPAVFHRSQENRGKLVTSGKRSIFAQEIAARRVSESRVLSAEEVVPNLDPPEGAVTCETPTPRDQRDHILGNSHSFQGPHLITGKGLRGQEAQQEAQTIHKENVARLQAMDPEEILQEQQRLLAQLGMGARLSSWDQNCKFQLALITRLSAYLQLNSFDLRSHLCRFIAEAPQELPLPPEEAETLCTEAFRLWAVAASYGHGSELYRELYPVLMRALQAVPMELSNHPLQRLSMQRIASLLTLLTQLTLAASNTCNESTSDPGVYLSAPTSSVTWTQVSGLQPLVESCLKQALKLLPRPEMWSALGPVPTACLLFLNAYYQTWSQQPSLCPEDWLQDMERLLEELLLPLLSQPPLSRLWDSLRHYSPLCNLLSCTPAPEALSSLVSLRCTGGCPPVSLAGSASPFPFLTALLSLFNTLAQIHKGICGQLAAVLAAPGLQNYFLQCVAPGTAPHLTPFSAWALRHEYHLQYLVLSLAQKVAAFQPVLTTNTALLHAMALALLSRLLPGSEYLAQELLLSCVFRLEFLPEYASGGPEAADFSDRLSLGSSGDHQCGRGALLVQACQDLPSIRSCYLTHCLPARASLLASQALHRGVLQQVSTLLLPVPKETLLPTDWPFLPLIQLYHQASDTPSGVPPVDTLGTAMRVLQWVLVLESWRPEALWTVPPAARLARLMCVFLVDSELFREIPVQRLVAALLARLCQPQVLPSLNLDCPLPGLTSFPDLYASFLEHFEAVSFGDHLFGALVLLPLQRRFSVTLRLALFGEHVGALRALGLPLNQLPVSLECYTGPPEDNLALLQLYFRTLVTGALRPHWCPVLYAVAVAHVNSFIFSQDPKSSDEVKAVQRSMLQRTWLLADECLRQHLLHYKLPSSSLPEGFELYSQLPPLRQQHLQRMASGVLQNGVSET
ncbi:RNA polymerase II-associated protein 1 [Ictidomys tridecemlineatus]